VRLTSTILLLLALRAPLYPAERWVKVSVPHFELYTQMDREQAMQALQVFEQARSFFLAAGFAQVLPGDTVRILDLASDRDYTSYLVKPGAYAMYQRGRRGDYIVMRSLTPGHYEVAVHEYTHYVLEHEGLKLPIWLNEGLAELYSTLEPRGEQCLIGQPRAGRLIVLATRRPIGLETLFAVDQSSPYYNDPDKMSIFYAESWALTHMLAVSDEYSKRFHSFLSMVSSGRDVREVIRTVYGKELPSVEEDLQTYLRRGNLPALLFNIHESRTSKEATIAGLEKSELELAVADLLSSNARAGPEAAAKVRELAGAHPQEAGFDEVLGYLALRENRTDEARTHFDDAVNHLSSDPVAIYNSARLQQAAGAAPSEVIPKLQRVLALNPDYEPARIDLGFTAVKAKQFELAISAFSRLKSIDPKVAFEVYYSMAYSALELRQSEEARTALEAAQQYARTTEQQKQAGNLERFIDRQNFASLAR